MKNKWIVLGTLLGVAMGAGVILYGIKKLSAKKRPISKTTLRRLQRDGSI